MIININSYLLKSIVIMNRDDFEEECYREIQRQFGVFENINGLK